MDQGEKRRHLADGRAISKDQVSRFHFRRSERLGHLVAAAGQERGQLGDRRHREERTRLQRCPVPVSAQAQDLRVAPVFLHQDDQAGQDAADDQRLSGGCHRCGPMSGHLYILTAGN